MRLSRAMDLGGAVHLIISILCMLVVNRQPWLFPSCCRYSLDDADRRGQIWIWQLSCLEQIPDEDFRPEKCRSKFSQAFIQQDRNSIMKSKRTFHSENILLTYSYYSVERDKVKEGKRPDEVEYTGQENTEKIVNVRSDAGKGAGRRR